jgi:hypothetical protein
MDVHTFKEVSCFFVHTGGDELACDFLQLIMWDVDLIAGYNVRCLCWQTTFQVELDCCRVVLFTFFYFSCLGFLVGLQQPLKVVFLKFTNILMFEFFCDFDALIPAVEFLIHSHGFLNFIILNEDCFSLMELLVEYRKLGLDSKVVDAILSDHFV